MPVGFACSGAWLVYPLGSSRSEPRSARTLQCLQFSDLLFLEFFSGLRQSPAEKETLPEI